VHQRGPCPGIYIIQNYSEFKLNQNPTVLALRMRGEYIHMAAKDIEKLEIGLLASADLEWRGV
jgi:hypothetical protein